LPGGVAGRSHVTEGTGRPRQLYHTAD